MKLIYKSILYCFIALASTVMFTSCEEETLPFDGEPTVIYVRVTKPEARDSLLVAAGQGSMVAIVGENLQSAEQIWFNDRRAELSPTYITSKSIITRVPSAIPLQITNKMKIVFANGDSLLHDFNVDIGEPEVYSMVSEYVQTGDIAKIRGQYFYEPLTVTFSGGVTGEIANINEESTMIEVIVPEGAQPGPVTITTSFGEKESNFWFRDNRNIIAGFEETDFSGWWHGKDFIVAADPLIEPINNKFLRIDREMAEWAWFEMWVGDGGTILEATKNLPQEAISNPRDYSMKFEINTLASLTGAELRMYMGSAMSSQRNDIYYTWKPNVDTKGEWQTIVIPFENFVNANTGLQYNPDGYQVSFHFSGPLAFEARFGLDNIRVVPNTLE